MTRKIKLNNEFLELKDCIKFKDKLIGFMFQKNIGCSKRFKCKSIHTFFMREDIDIIITDKNNNILYIYENFGKNKILFKKNAYYFYELPKSTNTYKINDKLLIIDEKNINSSY